MVQGCTFTDLACEDDGDDGNGDGGDSGDGDNEASGASSLSVCSTLNAAILAGAAAVAIGI